MAMTSAHGAGGLPVEAGYSHEYTALPASFFAFIGFGCSFISGDAMNNRSGIYGQPATPAKPYDTTCPVPAAVTIFMLPNRKKTG